jgi:hypothetical protein
MTKSETNTFTREQRKVIYQTAAELILEGHADFGCIAILAAAFKFPEVDFHLDVEESNFPEFFLFKEDTEHDHYSDAWLSLTLDPRSEEERNLRHDVLMLCREMCKD